MEYNTEKQQREGIMEREMLQIAAQLYTVRAYTKTEKDIAQTLKKIKEIGYDCVQVSAFGPYRPEFLRDALAENGLSVCVTHTPFARITEDTEKVIAEHLLIGCPYVGLGSAQLRTEEEVRAFLAKILPAAKKIRDAGLRFLYHNHFMEFCRLENGVTPMQMLFDGAPADLFGLIPDLYWLQYAGVDPVHFLRENAGRVGVVHLKDMCVTQDGGHRFAEIYAGNMNYDEVGRALLETGMRYAAVEQDDCYGEDPFVCLGRSRANLRARWNV